MTYLINPSLLAADSMRLGEEIAAVMKAGADMLHLDVMDNHYVPNLTFGAFICQQIIKRYTEAVIDVHLMAKPVDELIIQFAKAGARRISIHPDAAIHLDRSLELIKQMGCQAGLVLNPAASPLCLEWCQHRLDFVMVMTVNPGFGGQMLIPAMIKKISFINQHYPQLPICVDGGITVDNIASLAQAGAAQFVAGSAIFASRDYRQTITAMRQQLGSIES